MLEHDPDNVKALYRRATAYEQSGKYDEAKADLKRASEIDPEDKAVPKLMARVAAQIKRQDDKMKKATEGLAVKAHAGASGSCSTGSLRKRRRVVTVCDLEATKSQEKPLTRSQKQIQKEVSEYFK